MNPHLRPRLLALVAALLLGIGAGALPAVADTDSKAGRSGDQAAVAVNTKDGSTLFRFAFSIRQIMGEVVDQSNAAIAYASCEQCRTVAISVQVLLVSGSPDTVTPTNLAVALNEECSECQTLAAAYQFVLGTGDRLRFTREGRRQIAAIRRQFRALRKEDLTNQELQARADALAGELRMVLAREVSAERSAGGDDDADEDDDGRDDDQRAGGGDGGDGRRPSTAAPSEDDAATSATTPTDPAPAPTAPTRTTPVRTTPPAETTPAQTTSPAETEPAATTPPTQTTPPPP